MSTLELTEWLLGLGSLGVAGLVSVTGGLVSALWQYNKERKNIPPTFDFVDFIIICVTSPFAGVVFFFAGSLVTTQVEVLWALAATGAIGGLGTLISIKDGMMSVLTDHLSNQMKRKK